VGARLLWCRANSGLQLRAGLFALTAGRGWGAVSTNYGEVPSNAGLRGISPVIACYGGKDRTAKPQLLKRRLADVSVSPELHVYPDAGHSFTRS
jgi:acetyl esterase/lipase